MPVTRNTPYQRITLASEAVASLKIPPGTSAVFGVTLGIAKTEACKKTSGIRKYSRILVASITYRRLNGWSLSPSERKRSWGDYGSPAFTAARRAAIRRAEHRAGRKTLMFHDMHSRTTVVQANAKSKPIMSPKTKAPKVGFSDGRRCQERSRHNPHLIVLRETVPATWQSQHEEAG